ncbi:MAG TPA: hypothetical protein VGO92_00700 [Acidimicrobiales bacterium]|jgi:multiple sugar transport system permease protein|nr:hypothetical protein [Acidimicrobiales bacterium]
MARAESAGRAGTVRVAARAVVIFVFLAPVAFMVLGSLRDIGLTPPRRVELLPRGAGLSGYGAIGDHVPLGRMFRNSLLVVAAAVPVSVVVASWAGFAMARARARAQRVLVGLTL